MPRDTATPPEPFVSAGHALTRVAPHLPNTTRGLLGAFAIVHNEIVATASIADCMDGRDQMVARLHRDSALSAIDRAAEYLDAMRVRLAGIPDNQDAA